MLIAEIQLGFSTFYELAQSLLGDLPTQFEFAYVIVAVVLCIAFITMIFGVIGWSFRALKGRW